MEIKKRVVAKKAWICDLINGTYHKSEGWTPGYVECDGEKYSRVSLVATVVAKFVSEDGNYGALTLDDGTETIRLKAFGPDVLKIQSVSVGDIVRCVGKTRQYNEETYIAPEIIFRLDDPNWILLHRAQLKPPERTPRPEDVKPIVSEKVAVEAAKEEADNLQKKVLAIIKELDSGTGAEMSAIIKKSELSEEEVKNILFTLLKTGEIYEPKKGFLRILD